MDCERYRISCQLVDVVDALNDPISTIWVPLLIATLSGVISVLIAVWVAQKSREVTLKALKKQLKAEKKRWEQDREDRLAEDDARLLRSAINAYRSTGLLAIGRASAEGRTAAPQEVDVAVIRFADAAWQLAERWSHDLDRDVVKAWIIDLSDELSTLVRALRSSSPGANEISHRQSIRKLRDPLLMVQRTYESGKYDELSNFARRFLKEHRTEVINSQTGEPIVL